MVGLVVVAVLLIVTLEVLIVAAIDDLNGNITQLSADVQAYIAQQAGAVPAAQVETAAQNVAAIDAQVKAAQTS